MCAKQIIIDVGETNYWKLHSVIYFTQHFSGKLTLTRGGNINIIKVMSNVTAKLNGLT